MMKLVDTTTQHPKQRHAGRQNTNLIIRKLEKKMTATTKHNFVP